MRDGQPSGFEFGGGGECQGVDQTYLLSLRGTPCYEVAPSATNDTRKRVVDIGSHHLQSSQQNVGEVPAGSTREPTTPGYRQ